MADQNTPSQAIPIRVVLVDTSGNIIGSLPVTIADNGDYALGSVNDAAVTGDNTGTVSAKLRGLDKLLTDVWDSTNHVLKTTGGAGVGAVTIADGSDVTQGAIADAAWSGSGSGTVVAILKKIATAGGSAVTVADGADVAEGHTTDAAVITDANGTVTGFLRGLVKLISSGIAVSWAAAQHVILDAGTAEIGSVKNSGTFAVQAALNAETTKVIGTVNQGTSPWVVSGAVTLASTAITATVNPVGVASVVSGRQVVTTAGTAVQLSAQACKSVAITAETDNTGVVVLGDSGVIAALATRKGTPLSAGDTAICAVSNMNLLYADSTVSGDGVTWMVLS